MATLGKVVLFFGRKGTGYIFLHFAFDKWMEKNFPPIKFERYCDDNIVHCASLAQAEYLKQKIACRLNDCKLELNEDKTNIVSCPSSRYPSRHGKRSFNFLGYTFRPRWFAYKDGGELAFTPCMSSVAKKSVKDSVWEMQFKRKQIPIQRMAVLLNPKIRGMDGLLL